MKQTEAARGKLRDKNCSVYMGIDPESDTCELLLHSCKEEKTMMNQNMNEEKRESVKRAAKRAMCAVLAGGLVLGGLGFPAVWTVSPQRMYRQQIRKKIR
jgi:hypothetical protein